MEGNDRFLCSSNVKSSVGLAPRPIPTCTHTWEVPAFVVWETGTVSILELKRHGLQKLWEWYRDGLALSVM